MGIDGAFAAMRAWTSPIFACAATSPVWINRRRALKSLLEYAAAWRRIATPRPQ